MNALGSDSHRYVSAGVDDKGGWLAPLAGRRSCCFDDCLNGFAGEGLQVTGGQIFLAELDVVDAGARRLRNFFQEGAASGGLISRKCSAVGYVIEQVYFRLSGRALK